MSDLHVKLTRCFDTVFDNLDPAEIPTASTLTTAGWDSLNHVNLLTVICEEFGIELDYEQFAEATSYAAIAELLEAPFAHE
jgi:acyl carrier protein